MSNHSEDLHRRTLLVLVVLITVLFLWTIRSFIITLLLAAVFTAMAQPIFKAICRALKGRKGSASLLTLLILIVGVGVPLSAFLGLVATQAVEIGQSAAPWIEEQVAAPGGIREFLIQWPFLDQILPAEEAILSRIGEFASQAGSFLANSVVGLTRGTANFFLQLFVLVYAMYFFLKNGPHILEKVLYYIPLPPRSEYELVQKIVSVTRAVLKGSIVVGVVQGVLAGLAFWLIGIPGWAFWMTVMIVLSIIPAIGSALVWIPAVIFLAAEGRIGTAIALGAWCAAVVGSIDNFLRPRLIGRDTKLPDLLVLVGTLGGIFLFGAVGFILGPVIAALFLVIWYLYGEAFSYYLNDPAEINAEHRKSNRTS